MIGGGSYRAHRPWAAMAAMAAVECLLLFGAAMGVRRLARDAERKVGEISDLIDPSPFRAALLGYADKMYLSASAFLRQADPAALEQVADTARDFERSIPQFVRQNPRLFPPKAAEEIRDSFALLKGAIEHATQISTQRAGRRAAWEENARRILYLLDNRLRPLLRRDGDDRSETLLNLENQLRSWRESLEKASAAPSRAARAVAIEAENRGDTYAELALREALRPSEKKTVRAIRTLWSASADLAREGFALDDVQAQAVSRLDAHRQSLQAVLNRILPPMRPEELETRKKAIMRSIRVRLGLIGLVGLAAIASIVLFILAVYRLLHPRYRPRRSREGGADTLGDPAITMDLKGNISGWTGAAERLYGYLALEIVGQSVAKLFASDSEIARLEKELESGHHLDFDTRHKHKDGHVFPVRLSFRPITDAPGRTAGIAIHCHRL